MTKRSTAKRTGKGSTFLMGLGLTMLFAFAPRMVRAQVGSATVTGTVEDPSGAIIPGTTVTLTDATNQTHRTAKSDSRGFFAFSDLPASTYDATFKMQGFATLERHDIVVHIGDDVSIPAIHMRIASVSQAVTVSSEPSGIVPTTSGESAYTLTSKQIQNLDIEGRSAIELLGLVPGAADSGNFNSDAYSGQTAGFTQNASAFSVNGNRFDQTQIVSDGATVTDVNTAGSAAVTPNVDMVQEAKVETAAFLPENPNGPIVVSTETKSGGDHFHGEVYTTVRNHVLDDTDWRVKNLSLPKPQDSYYYPGANIGGPILVPGTSFNHNRDKLFFFAAFEKDLQYVQDPLLDIRQAVTPTPAMRMGDFSDTAYLNEISGPAYYASVTPCAPGGSDYTLCEGTTGIINPAAIDPNGQALINALPLPNANPATNRGFNLLSSTVTFQPRDQESLKLDYNINQRNHLSGRYNHEAESVPFPFGYYDNFTPNEFPAGQYNHNVSNSIVANLATALSNTLTNQAIFAYTRLNFKTYLRDPAAIADSTYGYSGPDLYNNDTGIIPNIQPAYGGANYASIYLEGGSYPTINGPQQTYVLNENVSKIYRSHIFKVGFYFAQQQFGQLTQGDENGDIETGEYGGSFNTGNAFADLLTGQIAGYSESSANFIGHMKEKRLDFFAQDQWKVTPRFSLNYGVRVNHIGAWYEQNGRMVVFDPALYNPGGTDAEAPGLVTHATNPAISISGGHPLGFQVAPDLGMAWDFHGNGSTILRAGFGTNYYTDPGSDAFSTIQAPPNETFTSVYELTTISAIPTLQTYLPLGLYGIGDIHQYRTPTTYSYTLALAQNFPGAIHVEMAYDGNVSKYLAGFLNTNPVPEGCPGEYPGYTPGTYNDTQCRPYALLSTLSTEVQNLSSFYNSAQITASKQTGVFNFWATYTFGKTMAYNCENPFVERRCYGPAPFDRSQNLNISYLINLPNVSAKYFGNHRVVNEILDGWQFTGIEQLATGTPLDVTAAGSANGNTGNEYDGLHNRTINYYAVSDAANSYDSPNFDNRVTVGTPDEQAVPTLICDPRNGLHAHQYYNASCFISPQTGTAGHPSIGTYNLPYIHGPRSESDDIGLYKAFKLGSSRRIQFRAQAFNVFNHPLDAFVQYDSALYLTYDAYGKPPTNPTQAGYATTKLGARTVQFEGKFYF
jgi:hypothetical protein